MPYPVIDLFAGPGGLGEGFSSLLDGDESVFRIKLSVEKDRWAHRTLELRAFFRQFQTRHAPAQYYDYLAERLDRDSLFSQFSKEALQASSEALHAELGGKGLTDSHLDGLIQQRLGRKRKWALIGGPPCQAYSIVGRSRRKHDPGFATDEKHLLYKHYLRILAVHRPAVFVMENVKGLLSAKHQEEGLLQKILGDLEDPVRAVFGASSSERTPSYRLYSLVKRRADLLGRCPPGDFVVRAEDYGIPQTRHRVILLGVADDLGKVPRFLTLEKAVTIEDVIADLPELRSGLSREPDSAEGWQSALREALNSKWLRKGSFDHAIREEILRVIASLNDSLSRGAVFIPGNDLRPVKHSRWYRDLRLQGVCNHETRSHIRKDLHRYLFVSAFGRVNGKSPRLEDLPTDLLPNHRNVGEALNGTKFNDRFRVQVAGAPSTTVTSHISKDGHYFIHYKPEQCRSLTVREAARLQTFPDNYYFEGPRTEQYRQVGNAVPPLLARKIAEIVAELLA